MTRGFCIAVTALPWMNQCAEIASTAHGRGSVCPNSRHVAVKRLFSSVFMGLPCPMKAAGILVASLIVYRSSLQGGNQVHAIIKWLPFEPLPAVAVRRRPGGRGAGGGGAAGGRGGGAGGGQGDR